MAGDQARGLRRASGSSLGIEYIEQLPPPPVSQELRHWAPTAKCGEKLDARLTQDSAATLAPDFRGFRPSEQLHAPPAWLPG